MGHEMLMGGWIGYAIFTCSVIICLSYQIIPKALMVIETHGRDNDKSPYLVGVISSTIFRSFIRICGINQILMSGVMLAAANHWLDVDNFWRTVLFLGEGSVAIVSTLSALAVWRVKWLLEKE